MTNEIINTITEAIEDIIDRFDADADREDVIEALDEATEAAWAQLVKWGPICEYDVDDLVETAEACAAIIKYAESSAWVEDDHGLWEGLTYGVLASIAYFSLRNCFYQALADAGYDTNNDYPFEGKDEAV